MYFVGGTANRLCFSVKYRKFAEFIQKIAKKVEITSNFLPLRQNYVLSQQFQHSLVFCTYSSFHISNFIQIHTINLKKMIILSFLVKMVKLRHRQPMQGSENTRCPANRSAM